MKCIVKVTQEGFLAPAYEHDAEEFEKLRRGNYYKADLRKARNPDHHRKGFALVKLIFESQEAYSNMEDLRTELKLKAGSYRHHVRAASDNKLLTRARGLVRYLPSGAIRTRLGILLDQLQEEAKVVYIPLSWSFADMDQTEFEELYDKLIDIAIQDYGLKEAVEFI